MKTTPAREQLLEARNKTVSDIIAAGLKVLFCGINPGLYSAAVNHHFARPGNRFWPALYRSGFTPRLYHPSEENLLLSSKLGITNIVARATASADEISREELEEGGRRLAEKVKGINLKLWRFWAWGPIEALFTTRWPDWDFRRQNWGILQSGFFKPQRHQRTLQNRGPRKMYGDVA